MGGVCQQTAGHSGSHKNIALERNQCSSLWVVSVSCWCKMGNEVHFPCAVVLKYKGCIFLQLLKIQSQWAYKTNNTHSQALFSSSSSFFSCSLQGLPQGIICLHLSLSLASSFVTWSLCMSSFTTYIHLLWGLLLFLLYGSSIFCPLSLLWTCQNHLSLAAVYLFYKLEQSVWYTHF